MQIKTQNSQILIENIIKTYIELTRNNRLSKVSNVSAFTHGQNENNIIYDDALKHTRVKDNDFDIIIANPPYPVLGFLKTPPQ